MWDGRGPKRSNLFGRAIYLSASVSSRPAFYGYAVIIHNENEQGKSVARGVARFEMCDSGAPTFRLVGQSDVQRSRRLVGRHGRVALQDLVDRIELVAR